MAELMGEAVPCSTHTGARERSLNSVIGNAFAVTDSTQDSVESHMNYLLAVKLMLTDKCLLQIHNTWRLRYLSGTRYVRNQLQIVA